MRQKAFYGLDRGGQQRYADWAANMHWWYTYHTIPGEEVLHAVAVQVTDLGSAISADCLTRPQ